MRSKFIYFMVLSIFMVQSNVYAKEVIKSTLDDQTAVEVTVYNNNLGLVKDSRRIKLRKGEGELRFMDVASAIMAETVHVKSLSHPNQFMVLEQNYEYDLMDHNKLLDKYVGKNIKLLKENYYQDTSQIVEAKLLSNNNGQPVYQIEDEIYLGYNGFRILPEIPDNLIAKPTLTWLYDFKANKNNDIEVSYLTRGFNWNADYILVLDKKDVKGDLSGWVTINNHTGAQYTNASLKLVAGEVNQVSPAGYRQEKMMMRAASFDMVAESAPMFQEQGFFEYHIYDLQRPTTLKNNQTKQISLLDAEGIKIKKEFLVYGNNTYYNRQYNEQNLKQPVNVHVKFENEEENKLGMPLPKGIIRLYKKDDKDKLQFVGEDRIEHTPKDEEVSLKVGEAFDVVAERKQTDYKRITTRLHETEWEITLKNHKEEDIVVSLIEPVYGNWSVVKASHDYEKIDAFTLRFDVPVEQDEEVKVKYRIRVGLK